MLGHFDSLTGKCTPDEGVRVLLQVANTYSCHDYAVAEIARRRSTTRAGAGMKRL
jgi:hypothetical protein